MVARRKREMPEEAEKKLGHATLLYASGRHAEALPLLLDVVRLAPNVSDSYHTLGAIYEAQGEPRRALDFFMVAAHLTPRDSGLWKHLATLSTELGFLRQAVYCLTKVLAYDRDDLDATWDRAVLYAELGELRRALKQFERVGRARPGTQYVDACVCVRACAFPSFLLQPCNPALDTMSQLLRAWHQASALLPQPACCPCTLPSIPLLHSPFAFTVLPLPCSKH